jgi:hypothetical protein
MNDHDDHSKPKEIPPPERPEKTEREQSERLAERQVEEATKRVDQARLEVEVRIALDVNRTPSEYRQLIDRAEVVSVRDAADVNREAKQDYLAHEAKANEKLPEQQRLSEEQIAAKVEAGFQPPYLEGTKVVEVRLTRDEVMGRFHGTNEAKSAASDGTPRRWCTLEHPGDKPNPQTDRPLAVAHRLELPNSLPSHYSEVQVKAGSEIRIGVINPHELPREAPQGRPIETTGTIGTGFKGIHEAGHIQPHQIEILNGEKHFEKNPIRLPPEWTQ